MRQDGRLFAILCGIALAAFAMRAAAFAQASMSVGAPFNLRSLIGVDGTNALGWALWAVAIVTLGPRLLDWLQRGVTGIPALVVAAGAPAVLVPAVVGAIHRGTFGAGASYAQSFQHVLTHNLPLNLLLGITFVAVSTGYLGTRRTRSLEVTAERLNAELSRAQLDVLRAQLNPHFLFNALNGITVLARRGQSRQVEELVDHLSSLLRHSLDASKTQHVPLRVEMEALRHYIDIEKVRRGDRLAVSLDVPDGVQAALVPSLLLQPLVENAIRHGADGEQGPLAVSVRARAEGGLLVIEVRDDGVGLATGARQDGIGLGHTRARLAGLYGEAASLALRPNEGGRGTCVEIRLPIEPARAATS